MDVKNSGWVPFLTSPFEGVGGRIDDSTNFQGYASIPFLGGTGSTGAVSTFAPSGRFWFLGTG